MRKMYFSHVPHDQSDGSRPSAAREVRQRSTQHRGAFGVQWRIRQRVGSQIRSFLAKGLAAAADIFAQRFEQEMKAGNLTRTPSARARGKALVDLTQGLLLRGKTGSARKELMQDARSYVRLVLGK
jgi:hypothetical protein